MSGFSLSINDTCRAAQYSQIPSDYSGLYAHATQLQDLSDLNSNCLISSDGELNFRFEECGTLGNPEEHEDLVFQTFVFHFLELNGVLTSVLNPIPIQCAIG